MKFGYQLFAESSISYGQKATKVDKPTLGVFTGLAHMKWAFSK
jgi:hypothetical protein